GFLPFRSANARLSHQTRPLTGSPGRGEGPVRIVAVRALDRTFIDAVLYRHFELCPYGRVAAVTQVALLRRGQQILRRLRLVDGVAVRADHIGVGMRGTMDVGARDVLRVALQAVVNDLFRLHQRKGVRDGGLAAARGDVTGPGSVAAFAAGLRRGLLAGRD